MPLVGLTDVFLIPVVHSKELLLLILLMGAGGAALFKAMNAEIVTHAYVVLRMLHQQNPPHLYLAALHQLTPVHSREFIYKY